MNQTWETPFRYIVLTALLVLFAGLLWYIRGIFQPLLTAALIAYFLSPSVNLLVKRFRVRRKTAAVIVYLSALAGVLIFLGTIVPAMLDDVQFILTDLQVVLIDLENFLSQPLQLGMLRLDLRLLAPALWSLLNQGPIVPQPADTLQFLQAVSRGALWALIVLVTAYYLMTDWGRLRDWCIRLAPASEQNDLNRLYRRLRNVWMQYLRGQLRLMFILAIIYSLTWQVIGLPGALLLGVLAGLFNLLPEVGPAIVAVLATLVAFIEGSSLGLLAPLPHLWFAVLTLGVYLLINTFKTVWLQPRILGQSVLLHEGVVFVAIVMAVVLRSVLGVLIVVPLLASAFVVGRYVRRRLLGLPPFEGINEEPASAPDLEPVATSTAASALKRTPTQKKTIAK